MTFEEWYRDGQKIRTPGSTPEMKEEARAAWELGGILYSGRKNMTAAEVHKAATSHANAFGSIELHNPCLFIKAFCRGYAEKRASAQPE